MHPSCKRSTAAEFRLDVSANGRLTRTVDGANDGFRNSGFAEVAPQLPAEWSGIQARVPFQHQLF
jgi:hypothetical protein